MFKNAFTIIYLLITCLALERASAEEGSYLSQKYADKQASRWTLAGWLAMKDRNEAMDYWLAMNSSVHPFEFFIEGSYHKPQVYLGSEPEENPFWTEYEGKLGAYATITGLVFEYKKTVEEENWEDFAGSFNLRVFGTAVQSTHLTLYYGLRFSQVKPEDADDEGFMNDFAGAILSLYLTDYFGIEGDYRRVFQGESNKQTKREGEVTRGSLFIDFSFIRLFGYWQKEMIITDKKISQFKEGLGGGLRIFF